MRRVGIVGAGAAAAATAFALRDAAVDVTVLEADDSVGGRAGSRRRDGCVYDHGTNYLKDGDERVVELVTETLPTDGLVEVEGPVWRFDGEGTISEGDGSDERKWTYRDGLSTLSERLLEAADATVETGVRVGAIGHDDGADCWRLTDTEGERWGPFDDCVLSPPAPETAAVLADAEWDASARETLVEACEAISYRPVSTGVFHYSFELARPYYALVNADAAHDLSWVARENCKPGHVPEGESLLVVQWSGEDPDGTGGPDLDGVADRVAELLDDERLADPDWTDHRLWERALPNGGLDGDARSAARAAGLHPVGDWVVGEARLHAALRSGLELGERLG